MTVDEIKASDKPMLLPADVAGVLRMDPQAVRDIAAIEPEKLGFPIMRVGTRTRIPRIPFLRFLGEEVSSNEEEYP